MGSLGSDREDELQPVTRITKKQKFTGKFLDDSASVPRKVRSAMKKRGRESTTPPLPVSKKPNHASNGSYSPREDRSKKSKLKKKMAYVSKDEEEVAKTLYSLANVVDDNTNSMMSLRLKSAGKDGESSTPQKASKKSRASVNVGPTKCLSNLAELTLQDGKFNSSAYGKQSELPFSKPSSNTGASGVRLESSPVQMQKMPTLDATPSGIQKGKQLTFNENENHDLLLGPRSSPTIAPSSQTRASLPQPNMPNLDATPSGIQIGTQLTLCENENNDLPLCPHPSPPVAPISQTQASLPRQKMPTLDATPSGVQNGVRLTFSENENNDLLLCPRRSPTVAPSSLTQASLPQPNMPNLEAAPSRIQINTQFTFNENENNDLPLCPLSSPAVAPSSLSQASLPQPMMPTLDATPSGIQIGTRLTFSENENNVSYLDLLLRPHSSPTVAPSHQTQASSPQSSTAKQTTSFDQPNYLYRPRPYEKNVINNLATGLGYSTKSWKNCATHIHMCRLIEGSKRAEKNGSLQVMNLGPRLSDNRQTSASFNNNITHSVAEKRQIEIPNGILSYQSLLRDQQRLASIASSSSNSHKRGSEFLSLAARGNTPVQSQSQSAMLSSLPHNGYLSSFFGNPSNAAANQVYLSGMFGGPSNADATVAKRLWSELDEQQKRMVQISSSQYLPGFNGPCLDIGQNGGRDSSSPLNYAQMLSQQFHSSLNPKNKGIMPHQQNSKDKGIMPHQQILAGNSSDVRRQYQLLSSGLGRNGAVFDPKSLQFQLLCNQQR